MNRYVLADIGISNEPAGVFFSLGIEYLTGTSIVVS